MNEPAALPPSAVTPPRRSFAKTLLFLLRRGHLYTGLFLLPWAVLYGVSAFLFNHPTAFSDQQTTTFGRNEIAGTPMADVPTPTAQAEQVVTLLNERQHPATPYRLASEAMYTREFAFATVKAADGRAVGLLFDVRNGGGTARAMPPDPPKTDAEKPPFAVGRGRGPLVVLPRALEPDDAIRLDRPLPERVKESVPTVLERTGFAEFAGGSVTVTSVPDVAFPVEADGRTWTATYNATAGSVTGKPAEADTKPELTARGFVTRLHAAHGYPGEASARWWWAVLADAMAAALCAWAVTGLIMWWQVKAARIPGGIVLALSAVAATALGFAMHAALAS